MEKKVKITLIITISILAVIAFLVVISMFGNPVSSFLAKNSATRHIENSYPDQDLQISKVGYNPKFGEYYANIESDSSIDTRFELTINHFGKIKYDSYADDVGGNMATYNRLDQEYRERVDKIVESKEFPFEVSIGYGTVNVGEDSKPLVFDKVYGLEELGSEYGKIVLYVKSETITLSSMENILLEIKAYFDKKKIPFIVIDLTIEKGADTSYKDMSIENFPYIGIYRKGFRERLSRAVEELEEYYKEQDKLKDAGSAS